MYEKLMIPLDGSEVAECVLPHVEAFLKNGLVKTAVLITVLEPVPITLYDSSFTYDVVPTDASSGGKDPYSTNMEYWERKAAERQNAAKAYLDRLATPLNQYGTKLKCEVLEGRIADTLADYAEQSNIDLILIATHGRSGVGRWLLGSVADRVLRSSRVPVFMVNAATSCGDNKKND